MSGELVAFVFLFIVAPVIIGIIFLIGINGGFNICPKCGEWDMTLMKRWNEKTDTVRQYYYCSCGYKKDV